MLNGSISSAELSEIDHRNPSAKSISDDEEEDDDDCDDDDGDDDDGPAAGAPSSVMGTLSYRVGAPSPSASSRMIAIVTFTEATFARARRDKPSVSPTPPHSDGVPLD